MWIGLGAYTEAQEIGSPICYMHHEIVIQQLSQFGCSCNSTMATANNGDVLMLEAAPDSLRPWSSSTIAQVIDALPYIDDDYGNPMVKEDVDRMVEEEMRRSSKKPADFLKDLPPLPKFNFEDHPMIAREYERVRAGRPPVIIDNSQARPEIPSANKMNDESAWKQSVLKAQCLSQHLMIRTENVELMAKYGPDVWIGHNKRLTAFKSRMQRLAEEQNESIEAVNRERKYHQQQTAYELNALSAQWNELCQKNIDIQAACAGYQNLIDEIKAEATERGWNLESNKDNETLGRQM